MPTIGGEPPPGATPQEVANWERAKQAKRAQQRPPLQIAENTGTSQGDRKYVVHNIRSKAPSLPKVG